MSRLGVAYQRVLRPFRAKVRKRQRGAIAPLYAIV